MQASTFFYEINLLLSWKLLYVRFLLWLQLYVTVWQWHGLQVFVCHFCSYCMRLGLLKSDVDSVKVEFTNRSFFTHSPLFVGAITICENHMQTAYCYKHGCAMLFAYYDSRNFSISMKVILAETLFWWKSSLT